MSQVLVKLQRKGTMVLPRSLRERAGLEEGTILKVDMLEGSRFLITPQFTIDRDLVTSKPKNRKAALAELGRVVDEIRQEAKDKGVDKMSKAEINRAVAKARRDLKNEGIKRPLK